MDNQSEDLKLEKDKKSSRKNEERKKYQKRVEKCTKKRKQALEENKI